ncbi:MAG TPA: hypothetical protein VNG69_05015 [Casimicrobiaceae bacterium]|nr:hypothetical protein [Casimicrobiaceae bacterium]
MLKKACCISINERVLYLSHATPAVIGSPVMRVPGEFELVTLNLNIDDERRDKIGRCEVVIVPATPLMLKAIRDRDRKKLIELCSAHLNISRGAYVETTRLRSAQ